MLDMPKLVATALISAGIYLFFNSERKPENEYEEPLENGGNRAGHNGGGEPHPAIEKSGRVTSTTKAKAKAKEKSDGKALKIADNDLSGNGGD